MCARKGPRYTIVNISGCVEHEQQSEEAFSFRTFLFKGLLRVCTDYLQPASMSSSKVDSSS